MGDLSDFRVAVIAADGFEKSELTEPVPAREDAARFGGPICFLDRGNEATSPR
jgi:hypothetical protein